MKLIDKNKLLEGLKELKQNLSASPIVVIEDVESLVESLEVKEVELEKEIKEQIDKYYENCNKKLEEMGEDDNDISFLTLDGFARHFYELGLKAKGE